jgi:hypothetical protein
MVVEIFPAGVGEIWPRPAPDMGQPHPPAGAATGRARPPAWGPARASKAPQPGPFLPAATYPVPREERQLCLRRSVFLVAVPPVPCRSSQSL